MKSKTMTELVAEYAEQMKSVVNDLTVEHQRQLQELTQRIGEQNSVINQYDAERAADEHLLRQALSQIVPLNEELNRAHGHEPLPNVVALMIDERLKNLPAVVEPPVELEDITDPKHILTADDEGNAVSNPPDSGWVSCAELCGTVGNTVKDFSSIRFRRRKPIPPVATVPAVDTDQYPSPFRMPFTDPRSGMGIRKHDYCKTCWNRLSDDGTCDNCFLANQQANLLVDAAAKTQHRCPKCSKDLDFDGDCEFCDGFVAFQAPPDDSQSPFSDLPL